MMNSLQTHIAGSEGVTEHWVSAIQFWVGLKMKSMDESKKVLQ
ncbi:hypothetical protein A2U01_0092785, partial [Trifolium medium]|nr:hypothetical protein [Trifolium medium]